MATRSRRSAAKAVVQQPSVDVPAQDAAPAVEPALAPAADAADAAPAAKATRKSAKPAVKKPAVKKPAPAAKAPKAAKPAKAPSKPVEAAPPVSKPLKEAKDKPAKLKVVRDSFTIPKAEYAVLQALKERAIQAGHAAKKSELLRAGLQVLAALPDAAFVAAVTAVEPLKTGRPAKA